MATNRDKAQNKGPVPTSASPAEFSDPLIRQEIRRAGVWLSMTAAIVLAAFLAQPLLLVVGGLVFAALLDGGVRLLGRVLPIGRGWRLLIVCLAAIAALAWLVASLGLELATQAQQLRATVEMQVGRVATWLAGWGISLGGDNLTDLAKQALGSFGKVTAFVGTAIGAISSFVMILVLGIFIAMEPRLYERGIAWMLPKGQRADFHMLSAEVGFTLRRLLAGRLLGMVVEGVFIAIALSVGGVPMAVLLGVITGLLAFIPNIGAVISGVLTVLVGFSAGVETGLWASGAYFAVQMIDGYLVVPVVARRSVDLAPALVLAAQLLFGSLFGILGLALADPIVAAVKVALEHRSRRNEGLVPEAGNGAAT